MVHATTVLPDFTWKSEVCLLSFDSATHTAALLGRLPRSAVDAALQALRDEVLTDHDLPPAKETWWQPLAALLGKASGHPCKLVLAPAPGFEAIPWMLVFERLGWLGAANPLAGFVVLPTLAALGADKEAASSNAMDFPFFPFEQAEVLPAVEAMANPTDSAMVLANPTGDLPYADCEARDVGRIVGVAPKIRRDATSSVLRSSLFSTRLLHLAAHVVFDRNNPLNTRIHLADNAIEAREILRYMSQAQLVVLSACESGSSGALGGEILGLIAALIRSGVDTVVASLWPVDDRATSYLMARFYEGLRDRLSISAALHQAMVNTRQQHGWECTWYSGAFQVFSSDPGATLRLPVRRQGARRTPVHKGTRISAH
jgi:hypothetical protein